MAGLYNARKFSKDHLVTSALTDMYSVQTLYHGDGLSRRNRAAPLVIPSYVLVAAYAFLASFSRVSERDLITYLNGCGWLQKKAADQLSPLSAPK